MELNKQLRLKASALLADIEDPCLLSESMTSEEITQYLMEESHTVICNLLQEVDKNE